MFNTQGISEALVAAGANSKKSDAVARDRARVEADMKRRRQEWSAELLHLWQEFQRGEDWQALVQSLETMGCQKLNLRWTLEFHLKETEKPFVVVYISGGYSSSRSVTEHSPEGYFSSLANQGISPQEAFDLLLREFNQAFEKIKHEFRYKHDKDYREECQLREANERQVASLKAWGIFLVLLFMAALGYSYW